MIKEIFTQYIELQQQIKVLEDKKKGLSVECLEEMQKNELKQVKNDLGTFSVVERKTWKYSDVVKTQETEIKELKKKEEESGEAKSTISESLRFQLTK